MSCLKPSLSSMLCVAMLCLALANAPCHAQNIWLNEIHYDNTGIDQNEFLEIALENSSTYALADFTISLYSGTTLAVYNSKTLNNFAVGSSSGNVTLFYFVFPTDGIQNNTSGVAIDYRGQLLQFVSYEGTFTPSAGPASAVLSEDIIVQESATSNVGFSLQLSGNGNQYNEFYWTPPSDDTPGSFNNNQAATAAPSITVSAPSGGYDFGLITLGNTTQPKNYTIIGANLTDNVVVTPPAGFELALDQNFTSTHYTAATPLVVSPINGTIKSLQIYVRFNPTTKNANYTGDILHASAGASDVAVAVKGKEGSPNAWINEFHYNDAGVDANEFIEVIVRNAASYDLHDFGVFLYDGSTGTVYDQETLDHFNAGQTFSSYSIFALDFTDHSFFDIENGPDGIALAYQGNLILFISYQGSFMATNGPAANQVSENLAPSESNATPESSSIYLINSLTPGSTYSDFAWSQSFGSNTMGLVNPLEVLPIVIKNFNATTHAGYATLSWTTSSEINNEGFAIQKSFTSSDFFDIGYVKSPGNSEVLRDYQFKDMEFSQTAYYRLKQIDLNKKITYSNTVIAESTAPCFHFFPNPATAHSKISLANVEGDGALSAQIVDQRGIAIFSVNGSLEEINSTLKDRLLDKHTAGIYYLKLFYENKVEVIKIILL